MFPRTAFALLSIPIALALGCGSSTPEAASAPGPAASGDPSASPVASGAPVADQSASAAPTAAPTASASASDPPAETKTELAGKISQEQVKEVLTQNADLFNDCYTIGSGKGEQFIAKVTVKATVGPKGNVVEASVVKSTAKNKKVDSCVIDAFKKIKFPRPKDAGTSMVTFPIEFNGAAEIKK